MPDHYTQLLEWRRLEASARGLAKIPHDFYATTRQFLDETRRTYESELRENPSGRKGDLARQTHQRAGQVARDIVEARVNKLLTAAFQASIGGSRELTNALQEERALFDRLAELLREHRVQVAPYLEPSAGAGSAPAAGARPGRGESPPPSREAPASGAERPGTEAGAPGVWVRLLKDGRPIATAQGPVDLRQEDLLTLPEETARLLVEAKIAEPVRPAPFRPGPPS